jgi:hypothetical protein
MIPWDGGPESLTDGRGGQQTTMVVQEGCLEWSAQSFKKNRHVHTGKQYPHCKTCGHQLV